MKNFIHFTNAFTGNPELVRTDLILTVSFVKEHTNEKLIEMFKDAKSKLGIQIDRVDKRYGENESHKLDVTYIFVRETFDEVVRLLEAGLNDASE